MALIKNIKARFLDASYIPLLITAVVGVSVTYLVYTSTQNLLKERLREKLTAIASTAALQISSNEIKNSADPVVLKEMVEKLKSIRSANLNLQYVYIFKKTDNPEILQFVADADMLATIEELDANGNGQIDDDEAAPAPNDEYSVSELPSENAYELNRGFQEATATRILGSDQWGTFMSGFAPIIDSNGESVALIGLDMEVSDFTRSVTATFIPFSLLAALLLLMLGVQTVFLIRIWKNRVEIVKELDRQKDELLGIVSHQLATPITSIKWYLEMMLDGDVGKLTKEQTEHLKSTQLITGNLVDLVGMILNVSRIQLGRVKIEKQELDLNKFFAEILSVIEPRAKEKNVHFEKIMPEKLPTAMLDRAYTRMTIENLLSNAVKYTPANGTVKLELRIADGKLHCTVTDTGMGIPKADQDKIFGKLFRATNVRNSVDGNGFGLYVAKGAVEAQGGSISFTSTEGKGTKFSVELPLK